VSASIQFPQAVSGLGVRCYFCRRVQVALPDDLDQEAPVGSVAKLELSPEALAGDESAVRHVAICGDCLVLTTDQLREGRPGLVAVVIESPIAALARIEGEDDIGIELAGVGISLTADSYERADLYTIAERLLEKNARDEAEIEQLQLAERHAVDMIERRYLRLREQVHAQAKYRLTALEAIAARLFPDAKAKKKSVALTFGSLARKDYAPVPAIQDDAAALAFCREKHPDFVAIALSKMTLQEAIDFLVESSDRIGDQDDNDKQKVAQGILLDMVVDEKAKLSLEWGAIKKAYTPALELPGIGMTAPRTEWNISVTSDK
jgi:hypothetical protein